VSKQRPLGCMLMSKVVLRSCFYKVSRDTTIMIVHAKDNVTITSKQSRTSWWRRFYLATMLCFFIALANSVSIAVAQQQDAISSNAGVDGRSAFAQCGACHSLLPSHNERGPSLFHLFGRKAGTVPGYGYSLAMKRAGIVWRDDTLMRFLTDPRHAVPGTTMSLAGVKSPQQTKALIDYLRSATR
jgi:cytochrome c